MKFITNRNDLLEALTLTGKVIGTSTLIPLLLNYLLKISGDTIEVTGGSSDIYIKNVISIQESELNVSIAVPKPRLFDLIKDLPNQPLNFEIIGFDTKAPTLKLQTFQGEYIIPIEPGIDYPSMEFKNPAQFNISSENLLSGFNKTIFSCGEDDLRPALTGVLIKFVADSVVYVSTNTNTLSTVTLPITEKIDLKSNFIVPVKVLKIIQDLPFGETVQVDVTNNSIQFTISPELVVQALLINERFPDYETVIPTDNELHFQVDRLQLLSSVKRVSKFSNAVSVMVTFDLSANNLQIASNDVDLGNAAKENLTITYNDGPLVIGLSGKYLSEILRNIKTPNVSFSLKSPNRAVVIKEVDDNLTLNNKENLILIMPMYLTQ